MTKRQPKHDADERRAKDREAGPAAEAVGHREDHLGAPLLVGPRRARRRERPCVDPRDRAGREDLLAGAQLIGEVHGREVGDQRGQDRERDGQERPESVEAHRRMLRAPGASSHRHEGPSRPRPTSDGRTARAPSS